MRLSRFWIAFAACSLGWIILSTVLAPNMSAVDVFYFRDAGWNLAAWGHFETAALARSHDLTPRLYSHYTPVMPLLFAGYASVFPRNAYAGTIFNLLLGIGAGAVSLFWVLRQGGGKLRTVAACAIAVLPAIFVTYDRPEALGLICAAFTIAAAAPGSREYVVGLLAALTFLAHPFAAAIAALWIAAIYLAHNWDKPARWLLTVIELAQTGATALVGIASVALLFYLLDPASLARFATNAFVVNSDIGVSAHSNSPSNLIHNHLHLNTSPLQTAIYFLSLASLILLVTWAIVRRRELRAPEWMLIAASCLSVVCAVTLFPGHPHYVRFLAFLIPIGMLIARAHFKNSLSDLAEIPQGLKPVSIGPSSARLKSRPDTMHIVETSANQASGRLRTPALALMLFAMAINLPNLAIDLLQRIEQIPSYRAAKSQPADLLAQMPDPNGVVVLEGDSYDVFKPEFRRLIELAHVEDQDHYASVAAVANCYDAFHGPDDAVRPLPAKLNAAEFHMIQAAPAHMWLTLSGHRLMRAQWGYGCDLYLRNSPAPAAKTGPLR